jgi:N-acetylglucosamine repressor
MLRLKPSPSSKSESNKRNMLLQALHRKGVASRLHLATELHISNSRVCDLIDEMRDEGLLSEKQNGEDRRGRSGVSVRINPNYGHMIGFDMEAKRLRMVATDFAGTVVWETRQTMRTPKDRQDLVDEILSFVNSGLKEVRKQFRKPLGFGIAASGVIDAKRGIMLHYDILPHAVNLPLRELIEREVDMPCVMENNIRAMTVAEWVTGAAKGFSTFICMAVRSGVGAGLIINGRLHAGAHGLCGETGYMVLPTGGSSAQWKNLQQTVSETALGIDVESDGTQISDNIAKRTGELIGSQLASIAAVIDPEAIILAGGMLNPNGPVWQYTVETFRRHALPEIAERVHILPAQLGAFAAAVGAAYRAVYELFPVAPAVV